MKKRIFWSIFLVALLVMASSAVIIFASLFNYSEGRQREELKGAWMLAAEGVQKEGVQYLEQTRQGRLRFTWIDQDGTVLYDTYEEAGKMENHADRMEVQKAREKEEGVATRYSMTELRKIAYYAKRLDDGTILRVSEAGMTMKKMLVSMLGTILIMVMAALLIAYVFARRLSKVVMEPIDSLDLEHPLENDVYEEMTPLLRRIKRQQDEIRNQIGIIEQKSREFSLIVENMKEGFVLLDPEGRILQANASAKAYFGEGYFVLGNQVNRSYELALAIRKAKEEGHSECLEVCGEKSYQMDISRIESGKNMQKSEKETVIAMLIFDVTERVQAEKRRREFTANVSHKLKTPVQAIMGSAELLESGLVKEEDKERFSSHIYEESRHLVQLIEDIISLSRLDENEEPEFECVNLETQAKEVYEALKKHACLKGIDLTFESGPAYLSGNPGIIADMLYNLCDNAIKYNRTGGYVKMEVKKESGRAVFRISDNGIGIPKEDHERVFERFYQVDKSFSGKEVGTGLGLSIVKRAAMLHDGVIELESEVGKGTVISVSFPCTDVLHNQESFEF